ncbi:MAG: response regulator transcription factor [Ruminiclostridium sp.]|nr:response regulator transcription factor [Ruminiclostridium sp.]
MRFAVCDDKAEMRQDISEKIALFSPGADIYEFSNGEELIASTDIFDIIFLDIGMNGIDGMQAAKKLRSKGCNSAVIFVTAFEDRVFDAFEVGAFNFLVKPIVIEKFCKVLKQAIESRTAPPVIETNDRYITVRTGGISTKIALSEIIYAEVFNRIVVLHTKGGNIDYYGKISELEECADNSFFRCHRSFLINLRFVDSYTSSEITMTNGDKVILAQKRYSELVKSYLQFMKAEGRRDA